MSYDLALSCGCVVYVSCHPVTGIAHTRVIQARGPDCRVRRHEVGLRLFLWELLPEREDAAAVFFSVPPLVQERQASTAPDREAAPGSSRPAVRGRGRTP